jgi:hypothetical protein
VIEKKGKIILALMQIDNIMKLIKDNEYEFFMYSHLTSVDIELKRQLTNLNHSSTIKE